MIRAFFTAWSAFFLCALLFTAGHTHITDEEITLAAALALAWPGHSVAAVNELLLAAPPLPALTARPYPYGLLPLLGTAATLRLLVPVPALIAGHARDLGLLLTILLFPALITVLFWFCYHRPYRVTHLPRAEHATPLHRSITAAMAGGLLAVLLFVTGCLWLPLFLLPALLFGLTAACLHHVALRAGLSARRALALPLLACVCSSLLVWSDTIKDEVYVTAALAGTLAAWAAARPRLAALTLALAVLAKPAVIVAAVPLAWAARERRHRLLALLALIAAGALVAAGNIAVSGTLRGGYPAALPSGDPAGFIFPVWPGLAGHLLSPLRSIFIYNPFLLPVIPVIIRRLRRRTITRLESCSLLGALAYLLLISAWTGWEGEVGYANRLALPVVLLAAVMLPQALRTLSRPAVIGLGLLGLLSNLPGSAWDYANWYQPPEQQRVLVQEIRPQPLAPAAFTQTAEMAFLAGRALFVDFPRQYQYVPAAPVPYLPLEYHFWLNKPDLWPVYLAYTSGGPRIFAARGAPAAAFLPWLALLALCLLLLRRLWRFPSPA